MGRGGDYKLSTYFYINLMNFITNIENKRFFFEPKESKDLGLKASELSRDS